MREARFLDNFSDKTSHIPKQGLSHLFSLAQKQAQRSRHLFQKYSSPASDGFDKRVLQLSKIEQEKGDRHSFLRRLPPLQDQALNKKFSQRHSNYEFSQGARSQPRKDPNTLAKKGSSITKYDSNLTSIKREFGFYLQGHQREKEIMEHLAFLNGVESRTQPLRN